MVDGVVSVRSDDSMGNSVSRSLRALFVSSIVVGLIAACGSEGGSQFANGNTGEDGGSSGSPPGVLGPPSAPADGGGPGDCKPRTCAEQGIECGASGDGCGGIIADCGKCS